jgi:RNA polymerase sigma-70 factor (ECF subfamily)
MDEQALIEKVQHGDLEAYGQLMDLHVRRLRAFLALHAPLKHVVDEVAHETFVFAFRHIAEFKADTSFQAWLRAIADNSLRAELQRLGREHANKLKYAEHLALERFRALPEAELPRLEHLESCLQTLPPKVRSLLDFKYKLALSTLEIMQRLAQSPAWVRTTLCRVRKQLKECMDAKSGDPA